VDTKNVKAIRKGGYYHETKRKTVTVSGFDNGTGADNGTNSTG
jgi:predicted cupin superfamily sugar epimerase